MEKTLGGDRLGSGKKLKIKMHGYERSTHDLSFLFKTTMSAGTLVPFMFEPATPGDTWDIKLDVDIKTHPTVGPLFGSYKIQLDIFKADIRLYNGLLHNNRLGIGKNMSQVQLPKMRLYCFASQNETDDIDNSQINPSCILAYLDIRGVGYAKNPLVTSAYFRDFTALKFLMYWDCYKNYYCNKQEEVGYVIHNTRPTLNTTVTGIDVLNPPTYSPQLLEPAPALGISIPVSMGSLIQISYTGAAPAPETIMINVQGTFINLMSLFANPVDNGSFIQVNYNGDSTGAVLEQWRYIRANDVTPTPPTIVEFPLTNLDLMREEILKDTDMGSTFIVNNQPLYPYQYITGPTPTTDYQLNYTLNQEGLAIKTYQSDLFNNWLKTENIIGPDSISEVTAIDTTGGSFTIDTLMINRKVYDMLMRINISGGSYDDWLDAVYTHDRYTKAETPVYCGGLIKELIFQEVISNTETETQPLGTLAGKGVMANKHKGGNIYIKVDEPAYIIGIISLTPRLDYSQGTKWDNFLDSLDDLHKPPLDQIGYQQLVTNQMAWWTDTNLLDLPNGIWETKSAGFQPAWINYTTNVNKTRGNFAIKTNEMFMTLNRRYEHDPITFDIKDLTTYIDPVKFNHIFAQTSLDAQNFWTQIAVNLTVRRKMSARQIPNL